MGRRGIPISARTKSIIKNATKKQQSLIEELEKGAGVVEAYKSAGYRGDSHTQAMRSKAVQKALEHIHENTRKLTSIERQDVIEGLLSAISMAESLEDPATMIRGWNEIARLHGFHAAEKKEISMSGSVQHSHSGDLRLEQMSTQELLELSSKQNAIDIAPSDFKEIERRAESEDEGQDPSSEDDQFFGPTSEEDS